MSDQLGLLQTLIEPVTWALVHFLWQGLLVAAGGALVMWLARRATPLVRYHIACWTLLFMVGSPLLTLTVTVTSAGTSPALSGTAPEVQAMNDDGAAWPALSSAPVVTGHPTSSARALLTRFRWALFGFWLIGVATGALVHSLGWSHLRRLVSHGSRPVSEHWQQHVERLRRRLGLGRAVRVLQSSLIEVPAVIGWLRPVILLPVACLTGLERRQLEAVLAHELAHIWRRDDLVNLLQVVAETVLFYHPAVWWVSSRIRDEREHCCDEAAVALTHDRLTLARALLQLEELRLPASPRLAPTAASGSLVHRISRLLGGETMSRHIPNQSLLSLTLALSFLAAAGLTWAAVATQSADPPRVFSATRAVLAPALAGGGGAEGAGAVGGSWRARSDGSEIELRIETGTRHRSQLHLDVNESQLVAAAPGTFEVRREPGVFTFSGAINEGRGSGSFSFTPDESFAEDLSRYGVDELEPREMLVLATTGVDRAFVAGLDELGFGDELDGETLIALGIHSVTPDYIREITASGIEKASLEEFLAMRIHGVSSEWIAEMADLGFRLDGDELLAWKIHGIDRDFVAAVREQGFDLDADELVAWKIHGVDEDYIATLRDAGFEHLSGDELVAMKIHGVSPAWMREMEALGIGNVDAATAVAMRIHGVSAEYLNTFQDLGYTTLDADDLVAMRIHRVSPEQVGELADLGYSHVDPEDLVALRIHNVDRQFIAEQQQRHGTGISIEAIIENKVVGRD